MRPHAKILPTTAAVLLIMGCQSSPPAAGNGPVSESGAASVEAFPADRTATLWVKGLGCPY